MGGVFAMKRPEPLIRRTRHPYPRLYPSFMSINFLFNSLRVTHTLLLFPHFPSFFCRPTPSGVDSLFFSLPLTWQIPPLLACSLSPSCFPTSSSSSFSPFQILLLLFLPFPSSALSLCMPLFGGGFHSILCLYFCI